ncbi:MAG TPA: hypothetical protein VHB27_11235 [Rhodopila sp.]|uniref:DUF7002 family protein n=1 Tax=Rhodopila sp. TaxID=2480087 RepID=UPI002C623B51|nr:hypothetical protein [Rhodopila sp.]HVY15795.1 hypothetical protein [Rhodopila sp.]
MSPDEFAALHPRLFHLTAPDAYASMQRHGMRSASSLLRLFGTPEPALIETRRRPTEVVLNAPAVGRAVLNDNLPLSEAALAGCLDDGLLPADWLAMLNARIFFWASEDGLRRLASARMNRGRRRTVLVVDTLRLARAYAPWIDLSPINAGATVRRPARRGLATFSPLLARPYDAWRRQRGRIDRVIEVAVRCDIPDIAAYVLEVREIGEA